MLLLDPTRRVAFQESASGLPEQINKDSMNTWGHSITSTQRYPQTSASTGRLRDLRKACRYTFCSAQAPAVFGQKTLLVMTNRGSAVSIDQVFRTNRSERMSYPPLDET